MKTTQLQAGLVLLVLVVIAVVWNGRQTGADIVAPEPAEQIAKQQAGDTATQAQTDRSESATTSAASRHKPNRSTQPQTRPLPAFDAPFRDSFDTLLDATLAGDSKAGCRLVGEASRCVSAKLILKFQPLPKTPDQIAADPAMDQLDPTLRAVALKEGRNQYEREMARREYVENVLASCEGVDYSAGARSYYTIVAAEAGETGSQLEYAQGRHLGTRRILENPQLLDQYRLNARRFFDSALEAGDLRSIAALWEASRSFGDEALAVFLPDEWVEPGFISALTQRLTQAQRESVFHAPLDRYAEEPSAEQRARADTFYEQYFANSTAGPSLKSQWEFKPDEDPVDMTRRLLDENLDHCR